MGESSHLGTRVGDAEREQAVQILGEHLAAGRLDIGEHEERCAHARIARTRADVEELFADLPAPHPDLSDVAPPEKREKPPTVSETLAGVGALLFVLGLAAAIPLTIMYGMWWTFFVPAGLLTLMWVWSDVVARREAGEPRPS